MSETALKVAARWINAKGIPSGAPKQVKQVAKAWVANAKKAAEIQIKESGETGSEAKATRRFWADRLYISHETRNGKDAWIISDNYDRGPSMIYYAAQELEPDDDRPPWIPAPTEEWYYMRSYGSEKLMKGGFREALSTAQIMWTG
jgi:hypothetical protein